MNHRVVAGSLTAAVICAGAHWLKFTEPHRPAGPRRKMVSYLYGGAALWTGVAVYDWHVARRLVPVWASAAAATLGAYLVDMHLRWRQERRYAR